MWAAHRDAYVIQPPRDAHRRSVDSAYRLDPTEAFGRCAPLVVELGSGAGDAIVPAAKADPERDYLGVEVYRPGLAQTLARLVRADLANVRLLCADAVDVLGHVLPDGCIDELWTYFPDPWPKAKHHRRRLVSPLLADSAGRCLSRGGTWRLATDWPDYAVSIEALPAACPDLFAVAPAVQLRGPRAETRFERKAIAAGRAVHEITLIRR